MSTLTIWHICHMLKAERKYVLLIVIIGMTLIHLTGCGSSSAETRTDTAAISDTGQTESGMAEGETDAAISDTDQTEDSSEAGDTLKKTPQLPETGRQLGDFVPEGWELLDSAELDYNEDGIPDYVGILQDASMDIAIDFTYPEDYLWILFAIASDGAEGYRLDFQDSSFIQDYRVSLTAEGASFTTHTTYGSMLRWSPDLNPGSSRGTNDDTFTYRDGNWRRTLSEETYGLGDYITDYCKNDWESGVGIRKRRSSELEDIEENYEFGEYEHQESIEYDVIYEVILDEPPKTLEQIRKEEELSPYRVTDWEVEETVFAADAALSEDRVKLPGERLSSCLMDWNENYVLYVFQSGSDTDRGFYCLAMYDRQDKVLSVLAKEESEIDDLELYKGKIYYSAEIVEEEAVVGIRLNRMDLDGTGKETVFEYRYPGTEQAIMENEIPYLGLYYEIGGDEIIVEVYIGGEPHPFYRMKTDGSGQERIGQIP